MILSRYGMLNLSKPAHNIVVKMSQTLSQLFEEIAFLIIGISLFGINHNFDKIDFGAVLINFVFLFVSRFFSVMIVWSIVSLLRIKKISCNFQMLLLFSGIRGAMCKLNSFCTCNSKSIPFLWR